MYRPPRDVGGRAGVPPARPPPHRRERKRRRGPGRGCGSRYGGPRLGVVDGFEDLLRQFDRVWKIKKLNGFEIWLVVLGCSTLIKKEL